MKTRMLKCSTCGGRWEEPVRPGARPWECPTCNPTAARRRELDRERAARRLRERPCTVEVPEFLEDLLREVIDGVGDFPSPGREELASQIRAVAGAQGHLELRYQLTRTGALCLSWAGWLPATQNVNNADAA